jgi:uncharacterized protein (UPF0261 family)
MRTTPDENVKLGADIGRKLTVAKGPTTILLPLQGLSAIDHLGQPFDDSSARDALYNAIRANRGDIDVIELDAHINDNAFAEAAANKLLAMIRIGKTA